MRNLSHQCQLPQDHTACLAATRQLIIISMSAFSKMRQKILKQWIMKQHPKYYMHQASDSSDFQAHERLLLDLASKMLKRKICLIPLFPEDKVETFEPPMTTSSRIYYLLGCNKARQHGNFYVSIFKHESNVPIRASNYLKSILSRNFNGYLLFGLITGVTITSFIFYKYSKK